MSKRYLGRFEHMLDKQRRVAIPREWRDNLETTFYLIPAPNHQIAVLPESEFIAQVLEPTKDVDLTDEADDEAMDELGGIACECVVDGQGRIALSQDLMDWAGLQAQDKALLKGSVRRIKISRIPDKIVPVDERANKFLSRLKRLNETRKANKAAQSDDESKV